MFPSNQDKCLLLSRRKVLTVCRIKKLGNIAEVHSPADRYADRSPFVLLAAPHTILARARASYPTFVRLLGIGNARRAGTI
jgi:hypothetical protein